MKKCDFNQGLKQFKKLIKENNYKLRFASEEYLCATKEASGGYCSPLDREIGIQKGCSYEKTLYALAHEVGHMIDFKKYYKNRKLFEKIIKNVIAINHCIHHNLLVPKALQIFCIKNELYAWELGLELLQKFGVPFSVQKYKLQQINAMYVYLYYMNRLD